MSKGGVVGGRGLVPGVFIYDEQNLIGWLIKAGSNGWAACVARDGYPQGCLVGTYRVKRDAVAAVRRARDGDSANKQEMINDANDAPG